MTQPPVDPHDPNREASHPSPGTPRPQSDGTPYPSSGAPRPPSPVEGYPEGQLPYDAYPAPDGGVFEQASHESIAPVAPTYGSDHSYGTAQSYGSDQYGSNQYGGGQSYATGQQYGAAAYQDPGYGAGQPPGPTQPQAADYQTPPQGPPTSAGSAAPGGDPYGVPTDYQLPPDPGLGSDPATQPSGPALGQSVSSAPIAGGAAAAGPTSTGDPYGLTPHDQAQPSPSPAQPDPRSATESYGADQPAAGQFGADQYATEQYGVDQYGVDQYGADQYGTDQYGTDQYGADQYGAGQYGVEVDGFGWEPAESPGGPTTNTAPTGPGVRPAGAGVSRHAQLSYTSFDRPGERGGWQVKQVLGDLDEAETALLRDAVQTQFDSGTELPSFPTAEDIAAFPRRLLHAPLGEQASALWHTAPAGTDASGRPGNVFAHVLLDRDRHSPDGDQGFGRPIQLWRSSDWRTPFGADEVRATDLPDQLPRPTRGWSTGQLVSFLTDPQHWRLTTFTVLLDACARAMASGPPVVLVVNDVDRAAQWIAAVSRMMAPEQSRDLFFSTLERPHGLASAFAHQVRLACVPTSDQDAVVGERSALGCVVIDETEVVQIGDTGGAHRTASGDEVPVTPWCGLVTAVLADPERAVETLREADRIAAAGSTDNAPEPGDGPDPLWSLALAVARHRDRHPDALGDAATILASGAPAGVLEDPQAAAEVTELIQDHLGSTTADAWRVCSGTASPIATRLYAHRAIGDVEWLTRPEPVPLPSGTAPVVDQELVERARTMATDLRDMAEADPRTVAVASLRLADLLAGLGIDDEQATANLQEVADQVVFTELSRDTHGLVTAVGPIGTTARGLVTTAMEHRVDEWAGATPGSRLPAELLEWVLDPATAPTVPSDRDLTTTRRLRGELAVRRWRAGDAAELGLVGWLALAEDSDPLKAELFDDLVWPVEQLSVLQGLFEDRIPPDAWLATLKATEESTPLFEQICAWFGGTGWQSGQPAHSVVAAVAQLRSLPDGWVRLEHRAGAVVAAINGAAAGQMATPRVPFAPSAARDVQLAVALAVADPGLVADLGTEQRLESLRALFTDHDLSTDAGFVADLASHLSTLDPAELVGRIAAADPRFDLEPAGAAARPRWLDRMSGPDGQPVLREALRSALGDEPDRKEVTRWAREAVQRSGEDSRTVDRLVGEWVGDVLGADESRRRGLFRGGQ